MKYIEFTIAGMVTEEDFNNIDYLSKNKDPKSIIERFLRKTIGYTFDMKSKNVNITKYSGENCAKIDKECFIQPSKYIIIRFLDTDKEDYFVCGYKGNFKYSKDKQIADNFNSIENAKKAFEFISDGKELIETNDKLNAEFAIVNINSETEEAKYYKLTDKTVFSFEIDARL
jgi:hypothetical protein